jgi:hypothetical protein
MVQTSGGVFVVAAGVGMDLRLQQAGLGGADVGQVQQLVELGGVQFDRGQMVLDAAAQFFVRDGHGGRPGCLMVEG